MPAKIVIIDDSELAVAWAKRELEAEGYEVAVYTSGLGVQAFVREQKPQMVLMDVHMPALHGDVVCKMLKDKSATASVIVALHSSAPEAELRVRAERCGADGYIIKTTDRRRLVTQVAAMLARNGHHAR